jgi:3-isopropylmalate/(R)-2-methylmalate dehydratase small subunit
MDSFTRLTSRAVVLAVNNIDTDQIIPARFLKVVDKDGLGANLFFDWRYLPDGSPNPDFVLNRPESQGARILVAGRNFGCGSSREHAPWALKACGFQAVVAESFADIFMNNALKNGLLPVPLDEVSHELLLDMLAELPAAALTVDLERQTVSLPDGREVPFPIDGFSRSCLLQGTDELGYLLALEEKIAAYETLKEHEVERAAQD